MSSWRILFMLCSMQFWLDTFINMGHSHVKANKLAGFIRWTFIKKRTPHTYQQQRFFLHQHHTLDCDSLIARAGSCLYVFLSVTQLPNEWSSDLQKLICCSSCCHLKVLIQCIVCPLHWEWQFLCTESLC